MRKFYLIIFVLAGLFCFNQVSFAQKNLKIGIVDVEKIYKDMPEAVEADKLIKEKQKAFEDTLITMQQQLQAELENYQTQKTMMPADKQQQVEKELQMKNQQIMMYREQVLAALQKMSEEMVAPIQDKVNKVIAEVAKKEKINLVLKKDQNNSILYHDDSMDITFLVLDKLRRGSTK